MIVPIQSVLDSATARQYAELVKQSDWQDGRMTAGGLAGQVKANQQLPDDSETALRLGSNLVKILRGLPVFISAALPKTIFPPKFNSYQDGGYYGLHVDSAIMHLPNNAMMRTDISATLFLSGPGDYDGGELCIETQYGAQEVKLDAGDLILYPSNSLHEVKPVTRGTRICAFFWIESLVRDSSQRELLFDLDQSIQQLTLERGSADQEVRRLSGIYHNLVRAWANS